MSAPTFPSALTERAQWLAYTLPNKEPWVAPGKRYSNFTRLLTYAAALALAMTDGFAGVGFRFTATDPLCLIDIDWKHEPDAQARAIPPWAQAILNRFPGCYAEWSVSGKGLHVIAIGKPDVHGKSPDGRIEMYDRDQYVALTGDVLPGRTEVKDFAGELAACKVEYQIGAKRPTKAPLSDDECQDRLPPRNVDLSNVDLMRLLAQEHAGFFGRYVEGDLPPLPLGSKRDESKDDATLIRMLIEYAGWDEERLEALARMTALKREKWDAARSHRFTRERTTYLGFTIRNLLREAATKAGGSGAAVRARTLNDVWQDPDALKPPTPLISRLAWRGRVTVYSSPDKGGKSTLATAGVAALTTGQAFLDGTAQPPGRALWLKLEEHVSDFAIRAKAFGADGERLSVFELKPGLADVRREASERSADVVVIDVLIRWAGDRVKEGGQAYQWAPIMDELRELARDLDVAVLVLHHARRSDGKVRDSGEITANADVIIEQEALPKNGVQKLTVRGRFAVSDFAVSLTGMHYKLTDAAAAIAAAEDALDLRTWEWIRNNPGAGARAVRTGVGGEAGAVDASVARLLEGHERRIENRGTAARPKYHVGESLPSI